MPYVKNNQAEGAISPSALEITFDLLRPTSPSLAEAVRAALHSLSELPPGRRCGSRADELPLNAALISSLEAQTVGKILEALTDLGSRALKDKERNPEHLQLLHDLLEDWSELADWLLQNSSSGARDLH